MTIALASMFVTASLVNGRAPAQPVVRDHRIEAPARDRRDHTDRDRRIVRPAIKTPLPHRFRPVVQPGYVSVTPAPIYTTPVVSAPVYQPTELNLVGTTALSGGELDVTLGSLPDGLTQLRLEPRGVGSTFIDQVVVQYKNGTSQVVELDRSLTPSTGTISLSINDSDDIAGLRVIGQSGWGGALAIDAV